MKTVWIAGIALMASASAYASEEENEAAESEIAAAKDDVAEDERQEATEVQTVTKQCRYERVTGSRTKAYRICLTKEQWNRRATREQEEFERLRSNSTNIGGGAAVMGPG